jgi:HEAT repeat protein
VRDPGERVRELVGRERLSDAQVRRLGPGAVPRLIEVFQTASGDLADRQRRKALHALGVLGTDEAVDFLIATAENDEVVGWLQRAAVRSLGLARQPRALTYLTSLLEKPDLGDRDNAIMALGHSDDPQATRALQQAVAAEPDERLRQRARRSLSQAERDRG